MIPDYSIKQRHIDANAEYFPEMKKILRQWLNMLDEHLNCNPEQPCYWYNELTQVSLLASAAWRAGVPALTEIPELNITRHKNQARIDLIFETCNNGRLWIEGKNVYPEGKSSKNDESIIKSQQHSAENDLKGLNVCEGLRISALFIIPMLDISEEYVNEKIQDIIDEAEKLSPQWIAWFFPEKMRYFKGSHQNTNYPNHIKPGIILILKDLPC